MTIYAIRHADKEAGEFYTSELPLNNQPISEVGRLRAVELVEYFNKLNTDNADTTDLY